jgi:hypothetical protein
MLHTSGHFSYEVLRASGGDSSAVHRPRLPLGVPGGRYRSVAKRVHSYTTVGFVLAIVAAVLCEVKRQPLPF